MPSLPLQFSNSDLLASVALIAILLAVRLLVGRALKNRENLPAPVVRRWTANVRNLLLLVALVGLVMIWAPQLRTFALSLTAVAVALVVATKELILCLSGSALRTFTRAFSVGDYVEIAGIRGEVIDYSLLATRLCEFEEGGGSCVPTGREVIVPHSLLFGAADTAAGPVPVSGPAPGPGSALGSGRRVPSLSDDRKHRWLQPGRVSAGENSVISQIGSWCQRSAMFLG